MEKGKKFQPGDSVRLKSGGPLMTVDSWDDSYIQYLCTWFDDKRLESQRFNEESLEKSSDGLKMTKRTTLV
jgi:uncharacterized protein YodC (DUF2158 family)